MGKGEGVKGNAISYNETGMECPRFNSLRYLGALGVSAVRKCVAILTAEAQRTQSLRREENSS